MEGDALTRPLMNAGIAERRLWNQCLTRTGLRRPADVVAWFGAMQAQEYEPARWAIGLRLRDGASDAEVERAFDRGRILRTHAMRPTWHFVTPADIRWLVELTAPRVRRIMAPYNRRLELDARTLARGVGLIERALGERGYLTRREIGSWLERGGLPMAGQRLAHVAMHAELEGVICSGPRRGRQFTYALLSERAPRAVRLSRDEAVATLARRYFTSHGPATIRDFAWWSGLTMADGKRGLEMNKARAEDVDGRTYWSIGDAPRGAAIGRRGLLLPIYDEYLIAYRDREAVPHGPAPAPSAAVSPVTFRHACVVDGHVVGTWRTTRRAGTVSILATAVRRLTGMERRALAQAARHYESFVGAPVELTVD